MKGMWWRFVDGLAFWRWQRAFAVAERWQARRAWTRARAIDETERDLRRQPRRGPRAQ